MIKRIHRAAFYEGGDFLFLAFDKVMGENGILQLSFIILIVTGPIWLLFSTAWHENIFLKKIKYGNINKIDLPSQTDTC